MLIEDCFDGTGKCAQRILDETAGAGGYAWWGVDPQPTLKLPTAGGVMLKIPAGSWFHRGADGLYYLGRADARFDCDDLC